MFSSQWGEDSSLAFLPGFNPDEGHVSSSAPPPGPCAPVQEGVSSLGNTTRSPTRCSLPASPGQGFLSFLPMTFRPGSFQGAWSWGDGGEGQAEGR